MLYVYINDNSFRYDVGELIKVFMPPSSFEFIEEDAEVLQDDLLLTIYSAYGNGSGEISVHLTEEGRITCSVLTPEVLENGADASKKEIKDGIKRAVYHVFSKFFDYRPPWGVLTGVRPTKMVNEMSEAGMKEQEIKEKLKYFYYIQEEKINLLLNVCQNEREILKNTSDRKISLYIGIPFCPTKCIYCSFTSYPADILKMDAYMDALVQEIVFVGKELSERNLTIETLYIGGGTPTALSEEQLNRLLTQVRTSFDLNELKEYSIECGRPDTITEKKLEIMKSFGVHRISINPQTMKQETLSKIGRKHSTRQILEAYDLARRYAFESINMDLIAGLPNETPEDFRSSVDALIRLGPENITVHTLSFKKASKLKEKREEYTYKSEEQVSDMLRIASSLLDRNGYKPYYMYRQKYMSGNFENVGYCKNHRQCIYNIRIMEEKQTIIALGAGGISKVYYPSENRLERVPNVSNYEIYIERIQEMKDRKRNLIFANIDNKISNTL